MFSQSLLVVRSLQKQNQAFRQNMAKEVEEKNDRIRSLEQKLEAANKRAEELEEAWKTAVAVAEKVQTDFRNYRAKKIEDKNKFAEDA